MGHGPTGHRELSEVMPDHLGLDLHREERFSIVDRHLLSDEVRKNRDVAAVGAESRLRPLACAEAVHENHLLLVEASDVGPPRPRWQELNDLLQGHRLELLD